MDNEARKALEDKFANALGTGTGALRCVADAIHDATNTGDTTTLRNFVKRAKGKGDDKAASAVVFLMRQVWGDKMKVTKDKQGIPVFKTKGCNVNSKALDKIDLMVAEKVSLRGNRVTAEFREEQPELTPALACDKVKAYVTRMVKKEVNGKHIVDWAAIRAAVDAAEKEAAVVN